MIPFLRVPRRHVARHPKMDVFPLPMESHSIIRIPCSIGQDKSATLPISKQYPISFHHHQFHPQSKSHYHPLSESMSSPIWTTTARSIVLCFVQPVGHIIIADGSFQRLFHLLLLGVPRLELLELSVVELLSELVLEGLFGLSMVELLGALLLDELAK